VKGQGTRIKKMGRGKKNLNTNLGRREEGERKKESWIKGMNGETWER